MGGTILTVVGDQEVVIRVEHVVEQRDESLRSLHLRVVIPEDADVFWTGTSELQEGIGLWVLAEIDPERNLESAVVALEVQLDSGVLDSTF